MNFLRSLIKWLIALIKKLFHIKPKSKYTTKIKFIIGIPYKVQGSKVFLHAIFNFKPGFSNPFSKESPMANALFNLPDTMQVAVAAAFTDALGNPAPVTNPTLVVDNAAVGTLALDPVADPSQPVTQISGVLSAVGALGTVNVTATGTNPDGTTVSDVQPFAVVPSGATAVKFTLGTPTVIQAAAPPTT
jgi:hypothetical protein